MPGRVFRQDTADATHLPVFHQIEGLVDRPGHHVRPPGRHDRRVHQGLLRRRVLVPPAAVVLPVHRAVGRVRHPPPRRHVPRARRLRHGAPQRAAPTAGIDPEEWQGFAFGFGIDRLAITRPRRRATSATLFTNDDPLPEASSRASPAAPARRTLKVLLSVARRRLRRRLEAAPASTLAPVTAHDLSMLGMAVEEEVHLGGGLDGIVVARVARDSRQHPDANKVQRVTVDAGAGEPRRRVGCGAFNMAGRRPRAPGDGRHGDAATAWRSSRRKILGEYSNGMLLRARSRSGVSEESGGLLILDAGAGRPSRAHADQRGARDRARRPVGPRDQPEPARRHVRRRRGPRPRRPPRRAVHAACRRPSTCPSVVGAETRAATTPPTCAVGSPPRVIRGITVGPSPDWLARRVTRARDAARSATWSTSPTT